MNIVYEILSDRLSNNELKAISFDSKDTNRLISALDNAYVNKSSISLPYWADILGVEFMELFSFICADILDISIRNKYASLALNNTIAINALGGFTATVEYRKQRKLAKYMPKLVKEVQPANLTKVARNIKDNGLVRNGFAKSANVTFNYDIDMLVKYYDAILANTIKSMEKIATKYQYVLDDTSGYATISTLVLDTIIANPDKMYNLECNVSDQRGRAIYGALKRVFNPIGYKDARALISYENGEMINLDNQDALNSIYSFIAELLGLKRQTYASKILAGMLAYKRKDLPQLDLTVESDRKELHELIWLERIYEKLDELNETGYVYWNIPIEIDATMSLAQILACITNDKRLMEKTNIIGKEDLQDAWHIDGVRRLSAKTQVATFYGSSASVASLLRSNKIDVDKDEVRAIRKEFNRGAFSVIKAFKDAVIKESDVITPTYRVKAWNEEYTVEVNKFKAVGSETKMYMIWNPAKKRTKTFFMHNPIRVPDYKAFKTYFATGLVHNLDSKVADNTCISIQAQNKEVIAIHDAFLVLPSTALVARKAYAQQLNELHANRVEVLNSYRISIGAVGPKADKAFNKMEALVEPFIGELKAEISALK